MRVRSNALALRGRRFFVALACAVLSACATTPPAGAPEPAIVPPVALTVFPPANDNQIPTTSAEVFLGNLDSRIAVMEPRYQSRQSTALGLRLYDDLMLRYRILGNPGDLEASRDLLDELGSSGRLVAQIHLRKARMAALLHRFDDASRHIQLSLDAGLNPDQAVGLRREIALATGQYGEAVALTEALGGEPLVRLAAQGNLLLEQGKINQALRKFDQAQRAYRGVSPLALAWLYVQHGVAHLRHGSLEGARTFFAEAYRRLPAYYLAAEHLAETESLLGNFERADQLYQEVIAQTDNPQFMAARAEVLTAMGRDREARQLMGRAKARYRDLLREDPAAWWGHAVEVFLESEPDQALTMAQSNADLRGDVGSWVLLAETALAAGDVERACQAYTKALAPALEPPELEELKTSMENRCDR